MHRVESSFLRRSLVLSWVAVIAFGIGGCVWRDGGNGYDGRGWRGWDDGPGYQRHGDRNDHDHDNDGDHDRHNRGGRFWR